MANEIKTESEYQFERGFKRAYLLIKSFGYVYPPPKMSKREDRLMEEAEKSFERFEKDRRKKQRKR